MLKTFVQPCILLALYSSGSIPVFLSYLTPSPLPLLSSFPPSIYLCLLLYYYSFNFQSNQMLCGIKRNQIKHIILYLDRESERRTKLKLNF